MRNARKYTIFMCQRSSCRRRCTQFNRKVYDDILQQNDDVRYDSRPIVDQARKILILLNVRHQVYGNHN